jgi:hypothetical protein
MGMWGSDDPDCRKPLMWDGRTFDPETRTNIQKGKKSYDSLSFNTEHFSFYKNLIRIRKEHPVLSAGRPEFITAAGKQLSYRYNDGKEDIVVLFNLDSVSRLFTLPEDGFYTDLLSGETSTGKTLKLEPLSAKMLIRKSAGVSAGTLYHFPNFNSSYVDDRNIDVWVPGTYSRGKKYPVLYMHDGQMLFDSSVTWNKQEWQVDEIAGRLIKEKKTREFIIVGIWNNGPLRHFEYFPQKPFISLPQKQQDSLYHILRERDTVAGNAETRV